MEIKAIYCTFYPKGCEGNFTIECNGNTVVLLRLLPKPVGIEKLNPFFGFINSYQRSFYILDKQDNWHGLENYININDLT